MDGLFPGFVKIQVQFRPRRQADGPVELAAGATAGDLLKAVGQPASSTLVVRGSTPIVEDAPLVEGETILLLSSFSGG